MRRFSWLSVSCFVAVLFGMLHHFPHHPADQYELKRYQTVRSQLSSSSTSSHHFSVMSFNIRLDCRDLFVDVLKPEWGWAQRQSAVEQLIHDYSPSVFGVQELTNSQVKEFIQLIDNDYRIIGYEPSAADTVTNCWDWATSIVYDSKQFRVLSTNHTWLSSKPELTTRTNPSNNENWRGGLTWALMEFIQVPDRPQILFLNCHLNQASSVRRYHQAQIARNFMLQLRSAHPSVLMIAVGDFNSAPGGKAYSVLMEKQLGLWNDTWSQCENTQPLLISNSTSSSSPSSSPAVVVGCELIHFPTTLHSWFGVRSSAVLWHALEVAVFIYHGLKDLELAYILPKQFDRLHIDWMLFSNGHLQSESNSQLQSQSESESDSQQSTSVPLTQVVPRFMTVGDLKYHNFSSDHFPLIAILELKTQH